MGSGHEHIAIATIERANIGPEMQEYLKSTATIDCSTPSTREKAQLLIKGMEEPEERAKSLFYFVRDKIKYVTYSPCFLREDYRASVVLERGSGFCVQKAVLLAALARAIGIPARLGFSDIRIHGIPKELQEQMGSNLFVYHGHTELYIRGEWVKAVTAFDLETCHQNRFIPVEFDGVNHAMDHSHDLDGRLHVEYVNDHGYREDVPLDEMLNGWYRAYGAERVEAVKKRVGES